ncbi:PREDICTED: uncharacterized protein LOC106816422 [Priapulus caudatus]|uniref:Uncharacterized protein LOC106816422 n=1 Tax=Priapulus caudatus TaxID=37621 RepID=A0ABM1EWF8_PRICU|nr:PREDICTED: uncharacterized protein LOC106816422 [Priapulus caudatus]
MLVTAAIVIVGVAVTSAYDLHRPPRQPSLANDIRKYVAAHRAYYSNIRGATDDDYIGDISTRGTGAAGGDAYYKQLIADYTELYNELSNRKVALSDSQLEAAVDDWRQQQQRRSLFSAATQTLTLTPTQIRAAMNGKRGQLETMSVMGRPGALVSEVQYDTKHSVNAQPQKGGWEKPQQQQQQQQEREKGNEAEKAKERGEKEFIGSNSFDYLGRPNINPKKGVYVTYR